LGCSIAKEVIAVLNDGHLIEKGNAVGSFFLNGLKRIEKRFDVVKEVRGRGLLLALEFYPHAQITATWAYHTLLAKGFLVGYYPNGNILRFDPALTIDEKNIERLLVCIETILETTD
jgi:acetylornithine/succinyldiaminopimelate/putrescine aminotransferase